jgi:hypothetical protein
VSYCVSGDTGLEEIRRDLVAVAGAAREVGLPDKSWRVLEDIAACDSPVGARRAKLLMSALAIDDSASGLVESCQALVDGLR